MLRHRRRGWIFPATRRAARSLHRWQVITHATDYGIFAGASELAAASDSFNPHSSTKMGHRIGVIGGDTSYGTTTVRTTRKRPQNYLVILADVIPNSRETYDTKRSR